MILKVYSVYDSAVGAFLQPFMARSHGEATRMFMKATVDNSQISANVKDYGLYYLSEFNDVTGEYGVPAEERNGVPVIVISGREAYQIILRERVPQIVRPTDLSEEAALANGSGC